VIIFVWIVVLVGAFAAVVDFFTALSNATGAPQQAAGAAMALAWVVIPYCAARAITEIAAHSSRKTSMAETQSGHTQPPGQTAA